MQRAYFNETQRFRQWWIYAIILVSLGSWFYGLIASIHASAAENTAPDLVLIITGVVPLGLVFLLIFLKLETRLRNEGIYIRFKPLQWKEKKIGKDEIKSFEVRKYRALIEYGGWGIRHGGKKYGKAYNVRGNQGLQLILKNGKKLLIGTQKPHEIKKAMETMFAENQ